MDSVVWKLKLMGTTVDLGDEEMWDTRESIYKRDNWEIIILFESHGYFYFAILWLPVVQWILQNVKGRVENLALCPTAKWILEFYDILIQDLKEFPSPNFLM